MTSEVDKLSFDCARLVILRQADWILNITPCQAFHPVLQVDFLIWVRYIQDGFLPNQLGKLEAIPDWFSSPDA